MEFQPIDRRSVAHSLTGSVTTTTLGRCQVVGVRGELDVYTGPSLQRVLYAIAQDAPGAVVVADLTELTFLDSTGLGVLVGAHRRLRAAGGTLRLAGCRGPVAEILLITGLDRVFDTFDTVQDAASAPTA